MNIKQDLNNYTNKYTNLNLWKNLETSHYIFHYSVSSIAEKEIIKISETQENAYKKIMKELNLEESQQKIKYYIYQTEEDKKELMGDDGYAQAIWHDNSIHIVYNEKMKPLGEHEDTHLLTLSWGVAIGFLQEGLAEYMSGCVWGRDKQFENQMPDIKKFLTHNFWVINAEQHAEQYYFIAGLFTKFLIENFGLEKYKQCYTKLSRENSGEKNLEIFEEIFDRDCLNKFSIKFL